MPPLPHRYRFQPRSVAITPKSLDWASAHSRVQPDTADLSLCGARRPLALLDPDGHGHAVLYAVATQVLPTQDFTVRSALP